VWRIRPSYLVSRAAWNNRELDLRGPRAKKTSSAPLLADEIRSSGPEPASMGHALGRIRVNGGVAWRIGGCGGQSNGRISGAVLPLMNLGGTIARVTQITGGRRGRVAVW